MKKNKNTDSIESKEKNTRLVQDWGNFRFFTCDEKEREIVINLLNKKDYILPGDLPNQEKITEDSRYFAEGLARKLKKSKSLRHFGLQKIAENIEKLIAMQDLSALYFYICNLYGTVYWRIPYNTQRLPANPEAFGMFLNIFSNELIDRISETNTEETEENEKQ